MIKEKELINQIADILEEEKADDITILDVSDVTIIADCFIIASGRSVIHVKSIAEKIEKKMRDQGIIPNRKEGQRENKWVVLDFSSVILHILRYEEREYYELENLWGDAKEIYVKH
ncbi:hypothetical protein SYNTR_1432 [Candidatus Syntrophocurvum alkaliphilum]|uniref:Ribosomal silencing factor RsfS n=1 Tax=Candidatus Syntrophocurvum alkaliphilum TaxID=2293317 RepID=A0A6I6DBL0_9FIRM|nr:ribosome silencing factor [Candidatus Syntrophocurvum alkaliphilum]QGU00026.1 hypothetical protein SYNTR_1432 [Candidatus Syntrophocurvum alkaliphilum]